MDIWVEQEREVGGVAPFVPMYTFVLVSLPAEQDAVLVFVADVGLQIVLALDGSCCSRRLHESQVDGGKTVEDLSGTSTVDSVDWIFEWEVHG